MWQCARLCPPVEHHQLHPAPFLKWEVLGHKKRLFMQRHTALGESGGAPLMSKGMSRKTPSGAGCWKRRDGSSTVSTGAPSNGLEEGVTARARGWCGGTQIPGREACPRILAGAEEATLSNCSPSGPGPNSQVHCVLRGAFQAPFKHWIVFHRNTGERPPFAHHLQAINVLRETEKAKVI